LGIYAAALTPINSDFQCNSDELADHCLDLLSRGCSGIALFGTTGEGASFSVEERTVALQEVIAKGLDPDKIILGNGSSSLPDTVALIQAAQHLGCQTFLIAPPSFYKNNSEEGVIAFYRSIIRKVSKNKLKVILYHIPQLSGVPITKKIITTLGNEFPGIFVGIKESEGNLNFTKDLIDTFPDFKVFVGKEIHIVEAVQYGAAGSICGIANLYPELICSLYQQAREAHCPNQDQINSFSQALKEYQFIAAFKAIMEKRKGSKWHMLRPPLMPLNENEKIKFISMLQKIQIES